MIPKLYAPDGAALLSWLLDATVCEVTEERNGAFEPYMEIPTASEQALIRYTARLPVCSVEALFVQKGTQIPLKQSTVKDMFRKLKACAGIPRLHPHLLRHTFATRYLQAGGDIYSLQQILGHTSLEMVRRYVHQIPQQTIICHTQFSPLDNLMKNTKKP